MTTDKARAWLEFQLLLLEHGAQIRDDIPASEAILSHGTTDES